jgi:hypothetical protein
VVVIHPPASDDIRTEALARVQGELTAAGFDVVPVIEKEGTDILTAVETARREMQPLAVFAIFAPPWTADDATAQILFSDATRGRTLIERMPLDRQHPDHEAKVLAVRAVELLKANLVELRPTPEKPVPVPVAPPVKPEPVEPPPPRAPLAGFGIEVGLAMIEQFRQLGASTMPIARLSVGGQQGFGGRASLGGLGSTTSAGATFGLARVQQQLGAADLFYAFPRQRVLQALVSGGAGALHVRVDGDGFYPYQGRISQTWSGFAKAGCGAVATLGSKVSFVTELEGLVAFSPTRVLVGDVEVGKMGAPSLLLSAGIVGVF